MLRNKIVMLGLILVAFSTMAMTSVKTNVVTTIDNKEQIHESVSAEKFKFLIENKKGLILDVRSVNEVAEGFIKGAINIDYYSKAFKAELAKLDKSTPVFVYCRSGGRSGKAMSIMSDMGFVEVYNLIGGYSGWPHK